MTEAGSRAFVVGLGNPGSRYAGTRHNVGFRVLELLAERWSLDDGKSRFEGLFHDARFARAGRDRRVALLAPMTYMNCSGRSVAAMLRFFQATPGDCLVVLDDLALPVGRLRLRASGSAGGHNGLDDILKACGTQEVPRLRIGIGQPPGSMDPRDYVLSPFSKAERDTVAQACRQAAEAVEDWLLGDPQKVMEQVNRKPDET